MIDTNKLIIVYDDTGNGDDFYVEDILYSDSDILVCIIGNEWYDPSLKVIIYLDDNSVCHKELNFYYAKNG